MQRVSPERPVRPNALMLRLLDRSHPLDYLWLTVLAALPTVLAVAFGVHRDVELTGQLWVGYLSRPNFWSQVVMLPVFAFFVRLMAARIADVAPARCPVPAPPVVRLFDEGAPREDAYGALRSAVTSDRALIVLLCFVAFVIALDVRAVVGVYLTDDPRVSQEYDWSIMYLAGVTSKLENAALLASAYAVQTTIFVFRFLALLVMVQHNLFFLGRVWQRRHAERQPEHALIRLDVNDPERCLGLRPISAAFDTQAALLAFGGIAVLLSRFSHTAPDGGVGWDDLLQWPPRLAPAVGFPDAGQWILATVWIVAMGITLMPMTVKLLPLFAGRGPGQTLGTFLDECVPAMQRSAVGTASVDELAQRFARQSYWPTGDNRARILFFGSFGVLFLVLYPLRVEGQGLLFIALVLLGLIAAAISQLAFAAFRLPLRFVDERLVDAASSAAALRPPSLPDRPVALEASVFVSYRREDSGPYARLLHKALVDASPVDRVFMDLHSIEDGDDFVDRIDAAVAASDCMLVVVGPSWTTLRNPDGELRLHDPEDFVAREVSRALAQGLLVIPVLVGGAAMPSAELLPASLERFWRLHARALDDGHWDHDVEQLLTAIAKQTRR